MDGIWRVLLASPATFLTPDGVYAAITKAYRFDFHGAILLGDGPNQVQFGYVENKGHVKTGIVHPPVKYWYEVVRNILGLLYPKKEQTKL